MNGKISLMGGDADRVKEAVDIVSFIGRYVPLKKAGRNFKGLCPFHEDRDPSFTVSPERQTWHCFGCGRGGDVITFLMEKEGLDFAEALHILADQVGLTLSKDFHSGVKKDQKREILDCLETATRLYHYLLIKDSLGKRAISYLKKRDISPDSIRFFRLGYAPKDWRTTTSALEKKGFSRDILRLSGLSVEGQSGKDDYDRFRGRLMFPLRDHLGRVVGFSGRALEKGQEPKYLNSPETPVFKKNKFLFGLYESKDTVRHEGEIIFVEGNLDIVSAFQHNIRKVVAPLGTGLTDTQLKLAHRFAQKFYFCFDNDVAGEKATLRALSLGQQEDLDLRVICLFGGQDLDEVLRQNPHNFFQAKEKSLSAFEYLVQLAESKFDLSLPEGKSRFLKFVFPFLSRVSPTVTQRAYLKLLSEKILIAEEVIDKDLQDFTRKNLQNESQIKDSWQPKSIKSENQNRLSLLKKDLLRLCFSVPLMLWGDADLKKVWDQFDPQVLGEGQERKIFVLFREAFFSQKSFDWHWFDERLLPSERRFVDLLLLGDSAKISTDALFLKEIVSILEEIKKEFLRDRSEKIKREIESVSDDAKKKDLLEELRQLSQQLKKD